MTNGRLSQITNYKATDWMYIFCDPLGGSPSWKATPVSNFFGKVPVGFGVQATADMDLPTLGAEFLSAAGWTSVDWTGSWATGWQGILPAILLFYPRQHPR